MAYLGLLFQVTKEQVQSNLGTKVLFHLLIHITVYHQNQGAQELKQGRNLQTGTDVEAVDRCCIQACLPLLCLFPSRPQAHQPRDGTTYNGQGPLLLVTT